MDAKKLQLIRIEKGLSQQQLAEKAGLSSVTISSIERGIASPSPLTLGKIAVALGFPVDEFMEK